MKKKQLGTSNLHVSELGFGCMSLTGNTAEDEKIIHQAIDSGINFFDTADLYQFGMNEKSVGNALKHKRRDIILASKGGNYWEDGKEGWTWKPEKNYLKSAVKHSLHRLGTDYLDLYQLHGGTIDDPHDEIIEAFEDMKNEGLIRYYGISSIRPNVIQTFAEKSNIVSVMMQYSLLDRRPEEWFPELDKKGISVIARGPVARGLLSESYSEKINENGFLDYSQEELNDMLPQLHDLAQEKNMTLEQLALRYVMDQPQVASALAGSSRQAQVKNNIESTAKPALTTETLRGLRAMTKSNTYQNHR
ncbi:aldo/keto reductase [Salisediminibacterium halotolerans]|uniref:Predicted oxidoreductase n=1 Tax=Salisediminibacterium halotolerans TaxID=517425 RepID=A0A1H9P9V6_9BACI|nr:aldo/keto reductase [Salisediminibacterium haloalkalitolerans]SER44966.1 Predicted oxidoreductase [Salisediminibacterium haloalkalitolerans]